MKSKLEFNLPEDKYEFDCAIKGQDAVLCLSKVNELFRHILKYDIPQKMNECSPNETEVYNKLFELVEDLRTEFLEGLKDRDVLTLINS